MKIINEIEYYEPGEVVKILEISKQRLAQLRDGYSNTQNKKNYSIKPKFTENEDYIWERGRSYYKKSVIDELKLQREKKE